MGDRSPLPFVPGLVSNGEFLPPPPTPRAQSIEREALRIAEESARRRGMDRRQFLQTAGGMAAMLSAANLVAACTSAARLFGVDPAAQRCAIDQDALSAARAEVQGLAAEGAVTRRQERGPVSRRDLLSWLARPETRWPPL